VYVCIGPVAPAEEVSKPQVSSARGQQLSEPGGMAGDVHNDADESSDADGWDDTWDDEERWGDMEVRVLTGTITCCLSSLSLLMHKKAPILVTECWPQADPRQSACR